jgi:hypothetical protein
MNLTQLHSEWELDQKIDRANLDTDLANLPYLHHKYWRYYLDLRKTLAPLVQSLAELKILKSQYYMGRLDNATRLNYGWPVQNLTILRTDLDQYLDADAQLAAKRQTVAALQDELRFLEDVIKQINGRGYLYRTILEFMKFSHGA